MTFDRLQKSAIWQGALGLFVSAAVIVAGYRWLPPELVGVGEDMVVAERLVFAIKWTLPVLLWLVGCVAAVSQGRFWSPFPDDRKGSASTEPSPAIAVRRAVLQNSLEQTVIALGSLLLLATVLRGAELILIPVVVLLYLTGRVAFAVGYAKEPIARAFGMVVTGTSLGFAIVLAGWLIAVGR